jgi:hypothetical protein
MNAPIITASLGLFFAVAYAAPLSSPQVRLTPGVRYFGYGLIAGAAEEKALPAGSFYTEPGGVAHFAGTKADPVICLHHRIWSFRFGLREVRRNPEHWQTDKYKNRLQQCIGVLSSQLSGRQSVTRNRQAPSPA